MLEGFSGFDGSRHVRGFVQEAREAGGSGEGALEPEVRFSNRCHSICAAQLESKPDQRGKRQLRSHLHEAELGRACKHVAGDAYERSSGKHCGAHVAGDFPASAACRLARHDDVQGERDASSSGILASSRIRSSVTLHSEGSGSSFLQEGLLES